MLTIHQKVLVYIILTLATIIFTWPVGLLMTTFFFDINGHLPIRYPLDHDPE